ncbi:MAG TPA: glycosyltransferase [Candidatus Binatia bacterium]|nr:glycosyltransferase [Candidatus Binatia bacterium]
MNVLFVADRFPPARGGAAAAAARQAAALAPCVERLDVLVPVPGTAPGQVDLETTGRLRVFRVQRAPEADESLQLLVRTAQNLLAREGYALVHGFGAVHAGYVAAWVARVAGVPSVVSLRGNDVDRAMFHGPRLPFLTWTLQHADTLLGVSGEILDRVRALTGRRRGLRRVPNGVDATVFRPDAPAPAEIEALAGAPRPWVAFAGEARLKKGLPILLDLAARLAAAGAGSAVLLGGVRNEARPLVERWRARAGAAAAGRLREAPYVGDTKALAGLYAAMDLCVFPSLWDGMPNAALEAMAAARPVVASAVGGLPEIIEHGVSGFLVAPPALEDFAGEALAVLARPAAERARVGAAARARVMRDFTVEAERDAVLAAWRALAA